MPEESLMRVFTAPPRPQPEGWWNWPNVKSAQRQLALGAMQQIADPPPLKGRGAVIVGGGKYLVSAYVTARVLRHVGWNLPIQLWQFTDEAQPWYRRWFAEADVEMVEVDYVAERFGMHRFRFLDHWWRGWQLKAFALVHCPFREVLFLDADCYPVRNPETLFDWPGYQELGAVFWPDTISMTANVPKSAFQVFGIEPDDGIWTESGQILVNKELCWRELNLALHYNSQADYTYRIIYGDKDTFPIAWRRLGRKFARMWPHCRLNTHGILQMDEAGRLLFQHRIHDKFRLDAVGFDSTRQFFSSNRFNSEMTHESFCFEVLDELRGKLASD
jgi:hypothetical protein